MGGTLGGTAPFECSPPGAIAAEQHTRWLEPSDPEQERGDFGIICVLGAGLQEELDSLHATDCVLFPAGGPLLFTHQQQQQQQQLYPNKIISLPSRTLQKEEKR